MKKLILFTVISLFFIACSKDEDGTTKIIKEPDPAEALHGKWKVTEGSDDIKYLNIGNDNVYAWLNEGVYGFKSVDQGVCQVTTGQINFDNREIRNFTLTDNLLTLSHPEEDTLVFVQDSLSPEVGEWIILLNSLQHNSAPIQTATDIAFDGTNLWYGCAYASDNLYKLNAVNLNTVDVLPVSTSAWGIEYALGKIWTSSNGSDNIYRIDPTTGTTEFTSTEMGAWIPGIAFDGQYLWCASNNANTIYKYDFSSDNIVSQYELGNYYNMGGMTYSGGYLYACIGGVVHKCSVNPLKAETTYALKGESIEGITSDGTNFWVVTVSVVQPTKYRIHKVDL